MSVSGEARITCDIGGTFTDVVVSDTPGASLWRSR